MSFTPITTIGQTTPHYSSPSSSVVADSSAVASIRTTYTGYSSNYSISGGCTWWCSARSLKAGGYGYGGLGNAANWYNNYTGTKYGAGSYNSIEAGDILCFDDGNLGHVAFVESRNGNTLLVSEAANSTNHPNWLCIAYVDISSLAAGHHWFWSSEAFEGFLKNSISGGGGGGSDTPVVPKPENTAKSFATITNSPCAVNSSVTISLNRSFNAGGEVYWSTDTPVGTSRLLGSFSAGVTSVTLPLGNAFEALMPNETSKTFYLRVNGYFTDYRTEEWGGRNIYYHDGLSLVVTIPSTYKPAITIRNANIQGDFNGYPVAGYSAVSIGYTVTSTAPSNYTNTATIKKSSFTVNRGHAEVSGTSSSGTITLDPLFRSYEDYTLVVSGSATDSRNRSVETSVESITVKGYRVPQVVIDRFYRYSLDSSGEVQQDVNGPCLYLEFKIDLSLVAEGNFIQTGWISLNIDDQNFSGLVQKSGNVYKIFYEDSSLPLDPDTKYQISLTLKDEVMRYFGASPITTAELYLTRIPLSLYDDDDNRVGIAFGKEAEYPDIVEFASNMSIRVTDLSTGDVKTKTAYDVLRGTEEEVAQLYEAVEDLEDEVAVRAKSATGMTLLPLTQAQYDQLATKDSNTLYLIFED